MCGKQYIRRGGVGFYGEAVYQEYDQIRTVHDAHCRHGNRGFKCAGTLCLYPAGCVSDYCRSPGISIYTICTCGHCYG